MQTRSETQSSAQEDQVSHVVSANWCFFDPKRPAFHPVPIEIPELLFSGPTQECRGLFSNELPERYGFSAEEDSITFWRPKDDLPFEVADKQWMKFTDQEYFDYSFAKIYLVQSFSKKLKGLDEELLHLVVTADGSYSRSGITSKKEKKAVDTVSTLPEFAKYDKIVHTRGRAPLDGANLTEYEHVQNTPGEVIHDGRYPLNPKTTTTAPPINIYHPIFDEFVFLREDADTQPTASEIVNTMEFMQFLSQIHRRDILRTDPGLPRDLRMLYYLMTLVHEDIKPNSPITNDQLDAVIKFNIGGDFIPCVIIVLKRELGEDGTDPSTQAGISFRQSWISQHAQKTRDKCCCPTLILTGGGPWLSVMGAVMTDKVIVQHLTDMEWCGLSAIPEDKRVYRLARTFLALRKCIFRLQRYYEGLHDPSSNIPPFIPHQPHPRYYPYPTSFTYNNREIRFEYLHALEQDSACVTFRARVLEDIPTIKPEIVVKYVARYGEEAHRFLASKGYAPDIYYCGPMPETKLAGISEVAQKAIPGLSLRADLMHMVVMEYIEHDRRLEIPRAYREQLKNILEEFHCEGYAFGDFRNQNILVDYDGKLKLIDFNWCGPYDLSIRDENLPKGLQRRIDDKWKGITKDRGRYAHYPRGLSESIDWPSGVSSYRPIRPIHDWDMFEKIVWC